MDRIEDQPVEGAGARAPINFPRYVSDHLGQVLRNRLRDTFFMPVPEEMLRIIEALPQRLGPRDGGSAPTDAGAETATGG